MKNMEKKLNKHTIEVTKNIMMGQVIEIYEIEAKNIEDALKILDENEGNLEYITDTFYDIEETEIVDEKIIK